MALSNTQTFRNLLTAVAGEAVSANMYSLYADAASGEGFFRIAEAFRETAAQELVHTEALYRLIGKQCAGELSLSASLPAGAGTVAENLDAALHEEKFRHCVMYGNFATVARHEGFADIAVVLDALAVAELYHQKRFEVLKNMLVSDTLFKKSDPVLWRCARCGFVGEYKEAPQVCPVCLGGRGNFEELMRNLFA